MPLELNYHHLYYFWTCVRAGSLTAAARELKLSQSALSLQLKSLEQSVGRRLLERSRSGVRLTEEGRLVFERCERIFTEGEALAAALREKPSGPPLLRLGVSAALGREAVMALLGRLGPEPRVAPTVFVGPREDVLERLARRRLDLAVAGTDFEEALGASHKARRLDRVPILFVASPALAKRLAGFPRCAAEIPMLLRTREHPLRQQVEVWLRANDARFATAAESEDADLLRELAKRGLGVAPLHSALVADDLRAGRLVQCGPAARGLVHEVWAVTPAREPSDPEVRAAVEQILRAGPFFPRNGHGAA